MMTALGGQYLLRYCPPNAWGRGEILRNRSVSELEEKKYYLDYIFKSSELREKLFYKKAKIQ